MLVQRIATLEQVSHAAKGFARRANRAMPSKARHGASAPLVRLVIGVGLVMFHIGCVTKTWDVHTATVPPRSRVAVLVVDAGGNATSPTFADLPVYEAIDHSGLTPVALNDAVSGVTLAVDGHASNAVAGSLPPFDPRLLSGLQQHLVDRQIDYLMLVYMSASGLDRDLKVMVIRTEDLQVVATRMSQRRVIEVDPMLRTSNAVG